MLLDVDVDEDPTEVELELKVPLVAGLVVEGNSKVDEEVVLLVVMVSLVWSQQ